MSTTYIKKLCRVLFAAVFSVTSITLSSIAQAQGWYAGVGFGQSKADIECDLDITCSSDDTDTGWKLFVGNRFSPNAAVEFGYLNFGEAKINGTDSFFGSAGATIESSGFNMALVGFLPIGKSVNLIGKVGLFRWDLDASVSTSIGAGDSSESGIDPMFGIGASFDLGKDTAVRIEWERFTDVGDENETGKSDVDLLSASLVFRFQ
jgi:OOP family OmpA-OmpF porin